MSTCRTCRLCGQHGDAASMFKYEVRHYAHAECGFKKWGDRFLSKLTTWQINRLPALVCAKNGWNIERLQAYVDRQEAMIAWAESTGGVQ